MRNDIEFRACSGALAFRLVCIALMCLAGTVWPYANMKKQPISGPWEIVVQSDRDALQFPVEVPDENKPAKLNSIFPVMETSVKIKLNKYLPDLKWDTVAIEQLGGGVVAKLTVSGKDLNKEMWLDSDNPAKNSISSSIGGVAIRKLHGAGMVGTTVHELVAPEAVGIVSVWANDSNTPIDYVVRESGTIEVSDSRYKLSVLEYIPHYSVDTATKEVTNASMKPVNPAIKISLDDGEKKVERWLWSRFPSTPHMGTDHKDVELPVRIVFTEYDIAGRQGRYILVAASGSEAWILFQKDGKSRAEKLELNRSYPFTDSTYSFSVNSIVSSAIIKTNLENNSEQLLRPAIVATVEYADTQQKAVLELNKPYHFKAGPETLLLLYRRKVISSNETY
jgi:hypothetical protein